MPPITAEARAPQRGTRAGKVDLARQKPDVSATTVSVTRERPKGRMAHSRWASRGRECPGRRAFPPPPLRTNGHAGWRWPRSTRDGTLLRLRGGGGHAQGLDDPGDVPEDIVVGPVSHKWAVSLRPDKPGFAQHSKVVGGRRQADPVEHAAVTAAHLASPAIWRSMSSRTGCASAARSRTSASMGPDLMSSAPMITVAVGEDFLPMAARRPPRGHQASQMKYMPTPIMTTPLPRSMAPVQRPAARRRFTTPVNVPASTTGTPRPSA